MLSSEAEVFPAPRTGTRLNIGSFRPLNATPPPLISLSTLNAVSKMSDNLSTDTPRLVEKCILKLCINKNKRYKQSFNERLTLCSGKLNSFSPWCLAKRMNFQTRFC